MDYCKVCFKELNSLSINRIFNKMSICQNCYNELNVIFQKQMIDEIEVISIYEYNDQMKNLLYQFKGCFDIELKSIFLERHLLELRSKYINYLIVPIPSSFESDKKRGFNHIEEIFSILKLPTYKLIEKKYDFKQSSFSKKERIKVKDKFFINNGEIIKNKKVLIVDDILTTGSSMSACIELIKKYNPNCIKGLVISEICRNM